MNAPAKDGYTPAAFWPDNQTDCQDFVTPAKIALPKGKCILLQNKDTEKYTGEPFDVIEFNDAQINLTRSRSEVVVTYYGYLTALAGIEYSIGEFL